MGLRILYGEHTGDLLDACLEEICSEAILWPQKRAFLIVPEQTKADTERRYLEVRQRLDAEKPHPEGSDGNALMLIDVVSFQRFAHRILSETGGFPEGFLDDASKTMIIHQILQEGRSDFKVLSALSERIGFIPDLQNVLGDFLRYHVTPEKIRSLEEDESDPAFSAKMSDFALLMERMDARIHALGFSDQGEELKRLSDTLAKLADTDAAELSWPLSRLRYMRDTSIWIMGFGQVRDFTPQEWDVLDQLHELCEKMTVSVCADAIPMHDSQILSGSDAFYFGRQTLLHLTERFPGCRISAVLPHKEKLAAFSHLTCAYTKRCSDTFTGDIAGIRLFQMKSSMDELRYVAGEIRKLVLTQGYRYNEISVVLCDPQSYESNLHAVFAEYGLDPFLDKRRPLSGTVLMRFVTAILDLGIHGWSFRPLMACLKSGLCHITAADADKLENYCLKYGLFKGFRIFYPANYASEKDPAGPEMLAMVERVLTPVRQFLDTMLHAETCSQKAGSLLQFLRVYGGQETGEYQAGAGGQVEALSEEWLDAGDQDAALALVSSFNELIRLLYKLEGPVGETKMTLLNFRSILASGMDATLSGAIPSYVDQIQISDTKRGYQRSCRALFLVGATRSVFPYRKVNEGFLRGHEREKIAGSLQIPFPSRARDQVYADFFTAYALLDCPEERLYISCPLTEEPSSVMHLAQTVFPAAEVLKNPPLTDHDPRLFSKTALQRYAASGLPDPWAVDETGAGRAGILRAFPELLNVKNRPAVSFRVEIPEDLMNQRYNQTVKMSVSQMETYAACPYQHFGNYCLHLQEREIFEVQMNDIGSVLHRMFEVSLTSYMDDSRNAASAGDKEMVYNRYLSRDFRAWAGDLFTKVMSEEQTPLSQDPAFLAAAGNRILEVATHSLRAIFQDISPAGFSPDRMEWNMGEDGAQAVTMKLPSGRTVRFHGMIDRIDVNHEDHSFRIIDYKSGNKTVDYTSLYHGLSVQLPAYLHAYSVEHPDLQPFDAGYFYLTAPMISVKELTGKPDPAFMDKAIRKTYNLRSLKLDTGDLSLSGAYAMQKIEDHCKNLFAGHFPVEPALLPKNGGKAACEYCSCKPVCGIDPARPPYKRLPPIPALTDADGKKEKDRDAYCTSVRNRLSEIGGASI